MAGEIICPRCSAPNPPETGFCGKCGTSLEGERQGEAPDPLIGSFVGDRFLVQKKLGEGGMGVVYLAEQTAINRKVALKVLSPGANDDSLYLRFRNEAAAASRLSHPNTITIYDFGKVDTGSLYIAMEFIEGAGLDEEIAQHGAIPWRRVCGIGVQICGSLHEAHEAGIIHRDMKSDNVMLCERAGQSDVVKVLDFGIAKILEDDGQDQRKALTKTGMVFGTPQYMAPEQIRGEEIDARCDVYAAGVILYQMLTGVLPFIADTPMGVLTKHLLDTPLPISEKAPTAGIPAELERLVMRALAKGAEDRPQTMKEFGDALGGILAGAGPDEGLRKTEVTASAVPAGGQPTVPSVPPPAASVPRTEVSPEPVILPAPAPKKRGLLVGIIVGAVVLLGAGGVAAWYFLWGPGSGASPSDPRQTYQIPLANPQPQPQPVIPQPQTLQPQPQPVAVQTDPEPLPAVPTDLDDNSGSGENKTSGSPPDKKGSVGIKKPKEAQCTVITAVADAVGKQVASALKQRQKAIKLCSRAPGSEGKATLGFMVRSQGSALEKIAPRPGSSAQLANCLKNVLGNVTVQKPEAKARKGSARFEIDRNSGVVTSCSVAVEAKPAQRTVRPPKDSTKDKKPKRKGKKGLKVTKNP